MILETWVLTLFLVGAEVEYNYKTVRECMDAGKEYQLTNAEYKGGFVCEKVVLSGVRV